MSSYVPVTIKGVNEVLSTAKNVQKETKANIKVTMVGFEHTSILMEGYDCVPVQKLKPVTNKEVYASGGTQMYDGIGYTLDLMRSRVKDGDTMFVGVFTDGGTGGDKLTASHVKSLIEKSHSYGITFALLAPMNQRAENTAEKIAIPKTNVMEYEYSQSGFRSAFYKLSRGLRNYLERQTNKNGVARIDSFFDGVEPKNATMKVNGLEVTMNMPETVRNDDEKANGELPGYSPVDAYVVDEYPACPSSWMNGSSKASSYFVPVKENHGMWLDFNKVAQDEHDIAVVISVQGVNPITGQKTSALRLEKYENKCPVHDKEFGQERFCKDCGFKWPSQNYISTTATPNGQLWLDGFRSEDGKVRQYIFTEEQARGVAKAIIGEDRVFAIGIAFYKSKEKKPKPVYNPDHRYGMDYVGMAQMHTGAPAAAYFSPTHTSQNWTRGGRGLESKSIGIVGDSDGAVRSNLKASMSLRSARTATKGGSMLPSNFSANANPDSGLEMTFNMPVSASDIADMQANLAAVAVDPNATIVTHHAVDHEGAALMDCDTVDTTLYQMGPVVANAMFEPPVQQVATKSYEVGAGEKIDQQVHADQQKMEYWQDEPFAFLYINYADQASVEKIISAGKRREVTEGFLAGVPVGV